MAAQLTCDMCDGEPAVAMITNLANGDTLAIGEACQLTFHLTAAAELIKAVPPQFADAYIEQVNAVIDAFGQLGTMTGILAPAEPAVTAAYDSEPPAPAEGPADENTAPREDQPAGDTSPGPGTHAAAHRTRAGNTRRAR